MSDEQPTRELLSREISEAAHELRHSLSNLFTTSEMIARNALREQLPAEDLRKTVEVLRALWRRANHQLFRFSFVLDPRRDGSIRLTPIASDELRILLEDAKEESLLLDNSKGLNYEVQWTAGNIQWPRIAIDKSLMAEAIDNLVDNARKYSMPGSTVFLSGGLDSQGQPFLAVSNRGIPISPDEAKSCMTRGWRSEAARTIAPGDGLGLWIVTSIMRLHGGRLEVLPTDQEQQNRFSLLLPLHDAK